MAAAREPYLSDDYLHAVSALSFPKREPEPPAEPLPPAVRALDAPPPEPIAWAVEDLWTKGDIGLLVGDGGAFKSSAALHMAAAIAGGYRVFDRFQVEQRPVLIVSAEDPSNVLLMRLEAFIKGHDWDRERVLGNVHFFAQQETSLSDVRWQAHLVAECKRLNVGFVVLDPLAELLDGDENSNTEVRPVIKFVRALAAATTAAVAIVHHAGKAGQDKRTLDRIRGASALASAARVILFFEFRPDGVYVENLKMSRAARLDPFVVQRDIQHPPGNRAIWTSARLGHQDAKQFVRTRAEEFVMAQLRAVHPNRLGSGELRRSAREAPGIRNEEIAIAQTRLVARNLIDWVAGPRNSKLWGLTEQAFGQFRDPAQPSWAGSNPDPAHPAQTLPGQSAGARLDPAHPFRGGAGSAAPGEPWAGSNGRAESAPEIELDDVQAEADERLGMADDST